MLVLEYCDDFKPKEWIKGSQDAETKIHYSDPEVSEDILEVKTANICGQKMHFCLKS